jgi:hypothetical protein
MLPRNNKTKPALNPHLSTLMLKGVLQRKQCILTTLDYDDGNKGVNIHT